MANYKGIEFAKGYNRPFADFKQEFKDVKVFRDMYPDTREKELKKAWKLATNGNINTTVKKSRKTNSRKDSK
ncbi:hypothetical protein [Polaribacter aestuariivivens]|uniref:hypothetical protein n=1 Tax=Polaribacter aestuariivivens TaxID=2304626 RepID=UPI003F499739